MLEFLQMLASGVAVGSSYALMGLAMVIIYKTSEVVNFAQGEMALLSIFLTYMVLEFHGFPFYMAFPGLLSLPSCSALSWNSQCCDAPKNRMCSA